MKRLKLKEALLEYKERTGEEMNQKILASKVLKNRDFRTREAYISKIAKGDAVTINIEFVYQLCEVLQIDANYLFGL